ncbi:DUF3939 domain-containing protein [Bacillus sp. ISL-41]|uniref:DUF3939 domain-containing protein n=1 Tax=Bacillus sp. ISL-41 TaxID=2819127 RepID=UPI001BED25FB|nr:DUF3939 domain-containing protein [Bacillus sp. ISL-41]MBT2640990.1 DUF3939 domain-containing protein [Bacillus sp. ISL-41]
MQTEKERRSSRRLISETAIKVTAALVWPIIGCLLDLMFDLFPYLTILGSAAGLAHFIMLHASAGKKTKETTWPIIEASVDEIKKAVRTYSEHLPKGVYRTILVKEDNRIDMEQLAPLLKGMPSRKFYMSKETYDIFTEEEKDLAITIDKVQKAVDLYVKEHKEYPVLPYDPLHRVNYYQLLNAHCLDIQPEIELYITNYDGLITHKKPEQNSTDN